MNIDVADDLATLGRLLAQSVSAEQFGPELARVEAEIARLTLELRTAEDAMLVDLRARQAAKAEVARLEQERETANQMGYSAGYAKGREAAEAEIERLQRRVEAEIAMRREASQSVLLAVGRAEAAAVENTTLKESRLNLLKQIADIGKELDRLRDGLRFYGDPATYEEGNEPHPTEFATYVTPIEFDKGERARALLAEDGAAQRTTADVIADMDRDSGFDGGAA